MNKLDRYDAQKLEKALELIGEVIDYNYMPGTPLSKKLDTVHGKITKILETELEDKLVEEYKEKGKV